MAAVNMLVTNEDLDLPNLSEEFHGYLEGQLLAMSYASAYWETITVLWPVTTTT